MRCSVKPLFTLGGGVSVLVVMLAAALLLPAGARAESKFKIKPFISAAAEYDSNFYRQENQERAVYTYVAKPGVGLKWDSGRTSVYMAYTLKAYAYEDKDSVPEGQRKANDSNYIGHLFTADGFYDITERLNVGLLLDATYSNVPTTVDRLAPRQDRERYTAYRIKPFVGYDFGEKWSARLLYDYNDIDYSETDINDSNQNGIDFFLFYKPQSTLSLNLDYSFFDRTWDIGDRDYNSNRLRLGFDKIYNYLSFGAWGGYHVRSYEGDNFEDDSIVPFDAYISWQNPSRALGTSGFGDSYLLSNSYVRLDGGRDFPYLAYYRDNFVRSWIGLMVGTKLSEKIILRFRGILANRDFERYTGTNSSGADTVRNDDLWDVYGTLGYEFIQNLYLTLTVGQENQDSNLVGFDWDNTYGMLYLRYNFDLMSMGVFRNHGSYYFR